jgi:hypothetical protein
MLQGIRHRRHPGGGSLRIIQLDPGEGFRRLGRNDGVVIKGGGIGEVLRQPCHSRRPKQVDRTSKFGLKAHHPSAALSRASQVTDELPGIGCVFGSRNQNRQQRPSERRTLDSRGLFAA